MRERSRSRSIREEKREKTQDKVPEPISSLGGSRYTIYLIDIVAFLICSRSWYETLAGDGC